MQKEEEINGESLDLASIDPALKVPKAIIMGSKSEALDDKTLGTKKKRSQKKKKNETNEENAQETKQAADTAEAQGTDRNYQTDRKMISTSGDQAETVADIEAQSKPRPKNRIFNGPTVICLFMIGIVIAFGAGIGFTLSFMKVIRPTGDLNNTINQSIDMATEHISEESGQKEQDISYPALVEVPTIEDNG